MTEEEKETIRFLKIFSRTEIDYCKLEKADVSDILNVITKQEKEIAELSDKLTEKICKGVEEEILEEYRQTIISKDKEIEELKKVIKMVEIYKSHGIPEDAEMVLMHKKDFLRNTNNEFISKDKIREKIKEIENRKPIPKELSFKAFYSIEEIREIKIDILKELLEK